MGLNIFALVRHDREISEKAHKEGYKKGFRQGIVVGSVCTALISGALVFGGLKMLGSQTTVQKENIKEEALK